MTRIYVQPLSSVVLVRPSHVLSSLHPVSHCHNETCVQSPSLPCAAVRPFHSSGPRQASTDSQTHYETLQVSLDASTAEIKKSFYKLSKLHHPDHNPQDPHAPRRFMRISEAYAVLGHTDKRAVYDRDVARHHPRHRHRHHHPSQRTRHSDASSASASASYHSTGPAGGRPASGLSRRRSTFRGPPPSFYRNTGSGSAAAGSGSSSSSSSNSGSGRDSDSSQSSYEYAAYTAYSSRTDPPNTPHFDSAANERTHRRLDERFAQRRAANEAEKHTFRGGSPEPSMVLGFLMICGAISAGVLVPVLAFGGWKR